MDLYTSQGIEEEKLKPGSLIKCRDKMDFIMTDYRLAEAGYKTKYVYKVNGEDGYWLEVI